VCCASYNQHAHFLHPDYQQHNSLHLKNAVQQITKTISSNRFGNIEELIGGGGHGSMDLVYSAAYRRRS
jgi:hypothetical protein